MASVALSRPPLFEDRRQNLVFAYCMARRRNTRNMLLYSWRPCLAATEYRSRAWKPIQRGGHWPSTGIRTIHAELFLLVPRTNDKQ
ncbi:hypothetical protein PoB_002283700 [Plakobranchus ocellatus]|uniref:Uncharacterized protein n=1 Tax=Plakobranchus ocellatus TaxID=259542 RepID=A0AAV3ZM97_9GAST|nr:hypothetical protein PoB_002283700 [Plakobranchus ocellatus]